MKLLIISMLIISSGLCAKCMQCENREHFYMYQKMVTIPIIDRLDEYLFQCAQYPHVAYCIYPSMQIEIDCLKSIFEIDGDDIIDN